jgi:hypothetical protein
MQVSTEVVKILPPLMVPMLHVKIQRAVCNTFSVLQESQDFTLHERGSF